MVIEIAGVPAEIRCRFAANRAFLRDYASDRPPEFSVRPSAEDLRRVQSALDAEAAAEGREPLPYSEVWLENNAIHALLAEQLVRYDVLLMHGSALCMDGQAYILAAKSGTGKSTHARLWREVFGDRVWMINDDKPMLKIGLQGATVYGTPWNGKHRLGRNASAPLKAILQLNRGAENRIRPLTRNEAFPFLMKHSLRSADPARMSQILTLETRLLQLADFYRLDCNMDPEAARVAWNGVSGGGNESQP